MQKCHIGQKASASVERARLLASRVAAGGVFHVECRDAAGKLKWKDTAKNVVVDVGLKALADIMFHASTQITTWYIGLINGSGTPNIGNTADTMASHAGWTEEQNYTGSNRLAWVENAATGSGGTINITNTTTSDFTITSGTSGSIYGIFLTSDAAKSPGNTGTLWATAAFSGGSQAVGVNDVLKITYSLTFSLPS